MELSVISFHLILSIFFFFRTSPAAQSKANTNVTDFSCSASSCSTYLAYRTQMPCLLDVGNVSDLFGVSRHSIARSNNLPSEVVTLLPDQLLFIPVQCGCTGNRSFVNTTYEMRSGDSYYLVSISLFANLTNYMAVIDLNPMLDPTKLKVGQEVIFPIFCKCPTMDQSDQGIKFLITYAWREVDEISNLTKMMNTTAEAFISANNNGNLTAAVNHPVLIPVWALPQLPMPFYYNTPTLLGETSCKQSRTLLITSILMGSVLALLLLSFLISYYFRRHPECHLFRRKSNMDNQKLLQMKGSKSGNDLSSQAKPNKVLLGVAEYIYNPTLFETEDIMKATMNLNERFTLGKSVYRANLNGELYAVKMVKGSAIEELILLQRVSHANLVKLAGVSTETDEGFFMVYEFAENGSLDQWLFPKDISSSSGNIFSWKKRLMIALDVANGLQYLHEHTRPSIIHGCIQTSNILLNASFKAKISNFSKAKPASEFVTSMTDVFAFGIVLLELLSGRRAMSRREDGETSMLLKEIRMVLEEKDKAKDRLKMWMDLSLCGSYPSDGALSLAAMARACISDSDTERPSMTEIVFNLSVLAHSCSGELRSHSKSDSSEQNQIVIPVVAR